ncbi:EboA domain-containing protein [Nocardioides sp. cx-169]|uniref:EboA domain-containing protein n=1 Tax=Nocardioides sp. cx-169 TaxID=2899080 RepID=UPI001E65782F|nr:EboA domain-containing protein [Nocardioides sp. cx-169]MCD4532688.1 EboA domain-containing protein [Nocardioides sp. cx-169]
MTSVRPLVRPAELRAALLPDAVEALDDMLVDLAADPTRLGRIFPAAARRTARGQVAGTDHRVEDAVRVELVGAAASRLSPPDLLAELQAVYRYGDADEKRAVVLSLGAVDDQGIDGSEVLLDALRTNDVRLVAAAMGAHADRLSTHDWRHAVLKCLFVGVPLAVVAGLATRADDELAAMVRRYVEERRAAGRSVPEDALKLLDLITSTTVQET